MVVRFTDSVWNLTANEGDSPLKGLDIKLKKMTLGEKDKHFREIEARTKERQANCPHERIFGGASYTQYLGWDQSHICMDCGARGDANKPLENYRPMTQRELNKIFYEVIVD